VAKPTTAQIRFWSRELRTPELLIALAGRYAPLCRRLAARRPLLLEAVRGDERGLARALLTEETAERARDRQYWVPLRAELDRLRGT
jgi:hypothetical protein